MSEVVLLVAILAALLFVPVGFALLGRRARRRGIGGSLLAPLEEIFDPRAHAVHVEVQQQAEGRGPVPAPGDPPL